MQQETDFKLRREFHYPGLPVDNNSVQLKPLFWDFVGKPVWRVDEKNPVYTIDVSAGFSYSITATKEENYAHILEKHKGGRYANSWLFFKDRNDANRLIKKVKQFIADNEIKINHGRE